MIWYKNSRRVKPLEINCCKRKKRERVAAICYLKVQQCKPTRSKPQVRPNNLTKTEHTHFA